MKIGQSFSSFLERARQSIGEAVVGDDFFRRDGVVDGIALGAGTGAVVGGVLGAGRGLYHQSMDQVSEVNERHSINDPYLNGYRYRIQDDWDTDCTGTGEHRRCDRELDGWWHNYSPRIEDRVVGSYLKPTLQHSHQGTVLGSAVTGAVMGAGVGAALGLATAVVGRALGANPLERRSLPGEVREKLIEESGDNALKGAALGAGVGADVGLGAGILEATKSSNIERSWYEPITQSKNLGSIPRNHYEWNWGSDWNRPSDFQDYSPRGTVDIVRPGPVLNALGEPRLKPVTGVIESARFGPLSGMVGGAVVGAGVGFATGIATSIVNRILVQNGSY